MTDSIEAIGAGFAVYELVPEDGSFELVSCNDLYEDILGKKKDTAIGKSLHAIFPRYISQPLVETFHRCKAKQVALESEVIIEYKGRERHWRSIISPILDSNQGKLRIIQTCVEITEKKILERKLTKSMKRFEAVVQSAYDGIITVDGNQNIKLFNQAAEQIFGFTQDELLGEPLTRLMPQRYRKNHGAYVEGFKESVVDSRSMQTRAPVHGLRKDGSEFPIEVTISKINIDNSTELTAVIRDISEKNRLMEELLLASQEDFLTGLYNRRKLTELINLEIKRYKRFGRPFSFILADIDYFKAINDQYGHDCGDEVIKAFAQLMRSSLRDTDAIGRWGGEEFLILLPEAELDHACQVAEKLRQNSEQLSTRYEDEEIKFTISAGVAEYSDANVDRAAIVKKVDQLMYHAKKEGRNRIVS
ncbi:sensor domain-containing diguanylate cyclase [Reinekea marinisedimentorum]|nr:sensor domain-containing diguanylate cyclase [Reinekea marinisedimentorum]